MLIRFTPFDCSTEEGRSQERHRRALLTSLAAAAAKMVSVLSLLMTVPLTLGYLGPERYGMWMTIGSFVAMMTFADLGIGNGLLNAIADAHGRSDIPEMRRHIASTYLVLGAVALVLLTTFAFASDRIDWSIVFNVKSEIARQESEPALAAFVVCFALNIPLSVIQRVQAGLQQGFTSNLWQCLGSLLGLIGIALAVWLQAPLPWLVAGAVGMPMIATLANSVFFFGVARRDLFPRTDECNVASIRRISGSGIYFFVTQIAIALAYLSDNLVIARILGPEAVAQFSVPDKMFSLITTTVAMALMPLWPAYSEAFARGDRAWIARTLIRSLKLAGGMAAAMSVALVLIGPALIGLWVGKAVSVPGTLLVALGTWKITEAIGNATAMYMNGMGMLRLQAMLGILMAICAIFLKFILVKEIGIPGVTVATLISYWSCVLIPVLVLLSKWVRR